MSDWDGKERRGMNQDQIDRDRLLTEVHTNVQTILTWTKTHEELDNQRFDDVNGKVGWFIKIGVACAIIIVANGGIEAFKTILSLH